MKSMKMTPDQALGILLDTTGIERETLRDKMKGFDKQEFQAPLVKRILEQLEGAYSLENAIHDSQQERKGHARTWLLTALGWLETDVAEHNDRAKSLLAEAAKKANLEDSTRYWALEALIRRNPGDLIEIAGTIGTQQACSEKEAKEKNVNSNERVFYLAHAILADRANKEDSLAIIMNQLESMECFAARRAMRVVPVQEAIAKFANWMYDKDAAREAFLEDAVQALAALPKAHPFKDDAIEALMAYVRRVSDHSWWDSMRAKALAGLRNLEAKDAQHLMEQGVESPNAVIMMEAALGLEALLGAAEATQRIVHAATMHPYIESVRYANALRYMDRQKVAEALDRLINNGSPEQQDVARELLNELGGSAALDKLRNRTVMMQQHLEAMEKAEVGLRDLFDASLKEARGGYKLSTGMNVVVFLLGLAMIVVCIVLVSLGETSWQALTTGGTGVLGILYNLFLANPRDKVRESVEHLMALKIIFLGYLRQLHQTDKAFARRFVEDRSIETTEVEAYSKIIGATMDCAVKEIAGRQSVPTAEPAAPKAG